MWRASAKNDPVEKYDLRVGVPENFGHSKLVDLDTAKRPNPAAVSVIVKSRAQKVLGEIQQITTKSSVSH